MARKRNTGNAQQRVAASTAKKTPSTRQEIVEDLRSVAAGGKPGGNRINEAYAAYRARKEQEKPERAMDEAVDAWVQRNQARTRTPQYRMAQDEAAEREASGYVSPENYAASIRANQRAAGRIRAGGVVMGDGRYHVGKHAQEELDRLAQSSARSELAMRAQEDETAAFRGSDYWLRRANELERKRKASRSGYGGMMQGGTAFRETPEFTEQDRQDWDKAREYYYQVKNAERWGSMPEDLRQKALEAAGYTTDSVLAWQDGDEAALAGMTPDQRAQRQRDQRARRNQIAAILAGAGYEPEAVIEYASRVRNAERMRQEMSGLAGDVTGRGAEGVARGVYGTVQSYATNLLSPIGSVGLLAQTLFRGGAGAEQYRPVDYNTPSMYFSQGTSTIRGAVGGQMGDVGRFFYDTVNSAVDSGVRMLVGQALGGGGIKPSPDMTEAATEKLNRFVSGFISTQMSGEVFANSFVQAKESGSTDADALLDSVTAAVIEGLTEEYSVESILSNPNGLTWTALRNSFLSEGSEEMASDFLNTIYDELKNGDDSELRTQYRELLVGGATEDEAFNQVFGDYVKQVVLDGLAGGISGIAMSGAAEYMTNRRYGEAYADPADTQALLDEARAANPDSRLLKRAEQRVAEGKGITGYQARELMGRNEEKLAPLKQASEKYGKQSGAMQATYQEGQDVAQYDMSYRVAYEMGKAGAKLSAAQTSEATDYLTDAQKQAAWYAGRDARDQLSDVAEVANGRALLNGQIAQVQTISEQDGTLMAEVRQGESVQTVALDSLKVDAGTRTLAEGAKQYGSAAGTIFEQYKAGQDVAAYLRAADVAAAVGMASPSASSETVLKNLQAGQLGKALNGEQITAIYKAGQTAGRTQLRRDGMTRLGTGTVAFEQSAKGAKLNARQKASVQFIRDLAKMTGIDFTIYQSSADSTGRLQGANGSYRDGTVHVDLNAGAAYEGKLENAAMLRTVSHELTHYMAETAQTEFSALQDFMVQRLSEWEGHSIQDLVEGKMATAEQAGHPITAQEALEEVVADGCEMMLRDSKAVQQLAQENQTLFQKVKDWMKKFFESLRKAFEGVEAVHPESIHMMENYAEELQKLWDEAFTAAVKNAKEGALGTAQADLKAADTLMDPTQEAAFSLRDNEKFQENAEKKNEALGLVPVNVMRSAAEARSQIAEIMRDPKLRDALNLPDDFSGKTYFADGAYNGTEENTTVCPRSMGAEELLDAVSELLGRPLTVDECINISQFMAGTELRPECEYCYVATDRKAYREFLGKYVEQRDAVLRRMENGMTDAENYRQLLNGRKGTKDMRSRFDLWVKTARSGGQMMQASDLTNVNKLMHDIIEPGIRAQVKDAMRYAQNASWAKKRIGYTAYNGHILNWSKDKITKLNKGFGLRMYSFSDFSPAFILENMQMITDASVRGLKMLAYTKDLDFVRIFAPSGININVSVFGFERNGVVAENALQGASWAEAQKLRAENPNVGITFVATNDTLVNWALAQDWIDVVIPYHLVRTGKQVAQRLGFTNYTAESSDVKQAGWTKGDAKEILPTQHNNDLQTYLRALEEKHLKPRFERFLDNPNYMKLVNETRRSALETPAVQPVFDVEAAKTSLIGMIKDGGYFQHIGGSVDRMYEIASDLSQKIYEGTKFSERDYSYETLTEKPDMEVTEVSGTTLKSRADIIFQAKQNAAKIGTFDPKTGSVSVYVKDIGTDVVLATNGLKHSLDRRFGVNAPVVLKAGEILQNSIRVNEMTPKRQDAKASYVLIGAARNSAGELSLVRSVVNRFSNEVTSMDVLYAMSAKKESAALLPRLAENSAIRTDSTISIRELLDYVNEYFPDVLPQNVLEHYGRAQRPETELGRGMKYQERDVTITPAEILDEINLDAVKGTAVYDALRDYKDALTERENIRQKLEAQQDLAQNGPAGERVKAKNRAGVYQKQFDRADTKTKQLRRNTALRQFVESEMAYVNGRQDALNQTDAVQGRYTDRFEQRLEDAYRINRAVQERYASMAQQYGTIPAGEAPARATAVPKQTAKGNRVSQTVRTAMEAQATTDEGVRALKKAVVEGNFSYLPITDKAAGSKATETIKDKGYQKALADWTVSMSKGHPGKDAVALGFQLYNQAINSGDTKTAVQVLTDLASRVREGAQMVQAVRMLKKLSPDNQLYSMQLGMKALQENVNKRYGKKAPKLQMNEVLVNNLLEAENEAQKEAAQKAIYQDLASQLPHTFMDRWNSWRYLCMLGNARTHVRNILGNAGFVPVRRMKDAVALGIETAYSKAKGGNVELSKGFVSPKSELYKLAKADYENIADLITGGGKYSDAASEIESMKSAFGEKGVWKYLSKIADANSFALDAEDVWFSKPAYAQSLAGYLKANKITAAEFSADEAIRDKARAYAVKEAQRATYRDYNDFSNFIAKVGRTKRGGGTTAKVASTLMEGVLPFRRTPANILVRGVEYSPIGLAQGIYQATRGVKTGKYTAAQAIDRIAAGLTGTALVALGALLTAHGILTPPDDDDEKQAGFDKLRGAQSYALKLGKTYVTVDWLAPEALPVFVGSQLSKLFSGDSEGGLKALYSALTTISEPMLEMSMLSSLQDVIENVSYADSKLMAILSTAATNYLTQAFPTLAGQVERITESERETTFATEDSPLTKDLQYILAKVMNKLPGEFQQIPYIDAWGRHEETGTVLARAFNNLLNPAYLSYDKSEPFEDELQRLYDLGYNNLLPQRVKQSQKVEGETLTQDQYVTFAETKGKTQYEALKGIIGSSWYQELSDAARGDLLSMAYSYADGVAKLKVNKDADVSKWIREAQAAVEDGGDISEILRGRLDEDVIDFQTANPQYADLSDNQIHGYLEYCEPAGVPLDTVYNAAQTCKNFEGDKDSDGKTVPGSKKQKVVDYIQGLGLSREQEKALWDALKGNWKDTDTPWE